MPTPLLYPETRFVKKLPLDGNEQVYTLETLCHALDIKCKASGTWINRPVYIRSGAWAVFSLPQEGAVLLILPETNDCTPLQLALATLAYGLHDLVAKASIYKQPWNVLA